ncbi:hypothetical protein EYF80_030582 [Liparis tanakae]|uniref:Uncharacterized protein n=1 Tax=Liparis tanakae TaxID=230148 RepID=A0A4Z2H0C4_9TELE|nr:hypothetical protein EYF80_030582 [Liparis tanakae]
MVKDSRETGTTDVMEMDKYGERTHLRLCLRPHLALLYSDGCYSIELIPSQNIPSFQNELRSHPGGPPFHSDNLLRGALVPGTRMVMALLLLLFFLRLVTVRNSSVSRSRAVARRSGSGSKQRRMKALASSDMESGISGCQMVLSKEGKLSRDWPPWCRHHTGSNLPDPTADLSQKGAPLNGALRGRLYRL